VVVKDLRKAFNGTVAVDGVSFSIEKGEIFGLLGPNGAGKTTTIRMLATTLPITSGDVIVAGHSVHDNAPAVRRHLGVCPQELALYPELSALDNLMFFGQMGGQRKAEAREQALKNLELVGLTDRARDRVSKFSGGMKRRVNLAISLMAKPDLLFLDEPTVGVDPQSRNRGPARRRDDRALHDPLHGRGRPFVRARRHHGRRTHRRPRHAAQPQGRAR